MHGKGFFFPTLHVEPSPLPGGWHRRVAKVAGPINDGLLAMSIFQQLSYPNLSMVLVEYLPPGFRVAFPSSQGVALVTTNSVSLNGKQQNYKSHCVDIIRHKRTHPDTKNSQF